MYGTAGVAAFSSDTNRSKNGFITALLQSGRQSMDRLLAQARTSNRHTAASKTANYSDVVWRQRWSGDGKWRRPFPSVDLRGQSQIPTISLQLRAILQIGNCPRPNLSRSMCGPSIRGDSDRSPVPVSRNLTSAFQRWSNIRDLHLPSLCSCMTPGWRTNPSGEDPGYATPACRSRRIPGNRRREFSGAGVREWRRGHGTPLTTSRIHHFTTSRFLPTYPRFPHPCDTAHVPLH